LNASVARDRSLAPASGRDAGLAPLRMRPADKLELGCLHDRQVRLGIAVPPSLLAIADEVIE
jgi:hypothetical protein